MLRAAVKVADEGGIESVTMRRLADELGAEAMSLYHVAKKEDILDGLVDVIAREINDGWPDQGKPDQRKHRSRQTESGRRPSAIGS